MCDKQNMWKYKEMTALVCIIAFAAWTPGCCDALKIDTVYLSVQPPFDSHL